MRLDSNKDKQVSDTNWVNERLMLLSIRIMVIAHVLTSFLVVGVVIRFLLDFK